MHPDLGSGHQYKDLEEKQKFQTGRASEIRRWVKPWAAGSAPVALPSRGSRDVPAPRHCSYPQLGSGPILTCPCQDIPAGPGKRLPGYKMGRAHRGSFCHLDPSPGLTPASATAPQRGVEGRWRDGGTASLCSPRQPGQQALLSRDGRGCSPCSPRLHPSRCNPPRAAPLPAAAARSHAGAVPAVPPHLSRSGKLRELPELQDVRVLRELPDVRVLRAAGAALRDVARRGGRAQGPGPARPGPAHTRQKNAAGPGPRGRRGGTAFYRRKQRPTRAPRPAGGMLSTGHRASPLGDSGVPRPEEPRAPAGDTARTRGPRFTRSSLEQRWLRRGRSLLEDQRPLGFHRGAGECPRAAPWVASLNASTQREQWPEESSSPSKGL